MADNSKKNNYVEDRDYYIAIHYYGDEIRKVFLAIGVIMLLGLPYFSKNINVGGFISVFGIVAVNLFAGMTSPRRKSIVLFDALIALIGTSFFELTAFFRFDFIGNIFDGYFWFNEIIAILFFVALYLSTKTLRGMSLNK